jgi:hypothetical protein
MSYKQGNDWTLIELHVYTYLETESVPLSQQDLQCETLLELSVVASADTISTGFLINPQTGGKVTGEIKS